MKTTELSEIISKETGLNKYIALDLLLYTEDKIKVKEIYKNNKNFDKTYYLSATAKIIRLYRGKKDEMQT